jgi:hypothetical protein
VPGGELNVDDEEGDGEQRDGDSCDRAADAPSPLSERVAALTDQYLGVATAPGRGVAAALLS